MRLSRRTIDVDLRCPGCGYNLRGLAHGAKCPECRTPAWAALKKHLFLTASPEYLARLTRGTRALLRSLIFFYLGFAAGFILAISSGQERLAWFGAIPAALSILWGFWLVMSPNPAFASLEPAFSARRLGRVGLPVSLAIGLYCLLDRYSSFTAALLPLFSPIGLLGYAALWATFAYYVDLADLGGTSTQGATARWLKGCTVVIALPAWMVSILLARHLSGWICLAVTVMPILAALYAFALCGVAGMAGTFEASLLASWRIRSDRDSESGAVRPARDGDDVPI